MNTIRCMLDRTYYNNKPQGKEIGGIQNRLKATDITIKDLANELIRGSSFRPSFLNGKKEKDWINQQIFALDFDEDTTIQEELNRCKELNILPVFAYTSFSHTKEHHKIRLVFCIDEVIKDYNTASNIQTILMKLFNKCDIKCSNLSRLYFGGRTLIYEGYDNIVNYKELLTKYEDILCNEELGRKGVPNKDNIYILTISGTPKTPSIDIKDNGELIHYNNKGITQSNTSDINYNVQAIKDHNIKYLKTILNINNDTIVFETEQQFKDFIFKIDLSSLLGIDEPRSFKCIFHDDNSPSASIFQDIDTGNYIYKCNSNRCGVSYNIIGCIEVLGNFKSRPKTYRFIKDLFNLEIMETDWQKEQKEILMENLKAIHNGELELNCPQTYKNNKRILRYLEQMHYIALENVYNEKLTDDSGNVVFFASRSYIANKMNISQNSLGKISDKLVVLSYHNLLNKLDDEEIPDSLLDKSKHINAKDNKNKYKRVNYFSIPSYTYNLYKEIEEQGRQWKENHYTMKGVSREMFFRAEGKEVADKLYPQYKKITNRKGDIVDRTTSINSDNRTNEIAVIIIKKINDKGYIIEKEIVEELRSKYGKSFAQTQIKRSLKEILEGYDLKRIRCNKNLKEQYGVTGNGYPFIIVKNTNNNTTENRLDDLLS